MTEQNDQVIRVAQIGVGYWGPNLLRNLMVNPQLIVKAVADLEEDRRVFVKTNYPTVTVERDPEAIIEDPDVDAVVIATPVSTHYDLAMRCVESGKHVLVEKPMATSLPDGIEIREAARKAGVDVMVGFCTRYAEGRRTMKTLIERGIVGDIVHVNAAKGGAPLQSWRADPEKGGGQLFWLGSHITDQILWMLGSEAERVYGEILWHPETGADQNSAYTIRFKDGVIANVLCSQNIGGGVDFIDISQ